MGVTAYSKNGGKWLFWCWNSTVIITNNTPYRIHLNIMIKIKKIWDQRDCSVDISLITDDNSNFKWNAYYWKPILIMTNWFYSEHMFNNIYLDKLIFFSICVRRMWPIHYLQYVIRMGIPLCLLDKITLYFYWWILLYLGHVWFSKNIKKIKKC